MPAVQPQAAAPGGAQRATFRPPWVKEGPPALPMPSSAPWMRSRELRASRDEGQTTAVSAELTAARDRLNAVEVVSTPVKTAEPAPVRRLSKISITPSKPSAEPVAENGRAKREVNSKPSVKPEEKKEVNSKPVPKVEEKKEVAKTVKAEEAKPTRPAEGKKIEIKVEAKKTEPKKPAVMKEKVAEAATTKTAPREKRIAVEPAVEKVVEVKKDVSKTKVAPTPPPAPPAPPGPPPPPPPGPGMKSEPLAGPKLEKIEALRSRPRKRPDWSVMMKEIETKRKLNHVVCNDRSAPLLATPIKVKEQFLYESEKPNVHNILLDQIQSGVRLKPTKTNDRSKPILDGLRKFRRQMTIEEQIQKASGAETETAAPVEVDELDDIDRVRDDLQSTKQMLALELRNREAVERENKKLLARLLNLEVELEKERNAKQSEQNPQSQRIEEEQAAAKLKAELAKAHEAADEMETKYHDTIGQLDMTKGELEDLQRKNQILERRLANYANRDEQPLTKQPSAKRLAAAKSNSTIAVGNQAPPPEEDDESEYEDESETETEGDSSDEEDQEAVQERRALRELKLLTTKLASFKGKEEMARKERISLREQLKKLTKTLKEEKKKYKVLQKEVDSMANVLKEDGSMACVLRELNDDDEEDEDEEEEESESESESSEESEDESDGDLPAEASTDAKKGNLNKRVKQHENTLAVLKKGNYMLKTNVDRLKDDLFKQKEMAITLQEDLNSVLAELG